MINRFTLTAGLALTLWVGATAGFAQQQEQNDVLMPGGKPVEEVYTNGLNRVGVSLRLGYNVQAHFRSTGAAVALHPLGLRTAHGDLYNYDDGYVLTDNSGNVGHETWYWGYQNASQIVGNTATFHRHTASAAAVPDGTGGVDEDDVNPGLEVTYNRELGRIGKLQYGLEAALNYMNVSFENNNAFTGIGTSTLTTDTYVPTTGTTIPAPAPYNGPFSGPAFVLTNIPISSVTSSVGGTTTIRSHREFNANIWGARLGPYLEYPIVTNLNVSVSGGLALALIDDSASWSETATFATGTLGASGGGDRLDFLWGYYVRGLLNWEFSENWFLNGGVQFQNLGRLHRDYGAQAVEMDLSKTLFFTGGIGYRF